MQQKESAISAVKNFQFDESDDDSFNRSAILFVEDYKTCHPGLLADNDYKKAYTQRIENEIKVLKSSNSPFAEKLSSLYEEAKNEMKKQLLSFVVLIMFVSALVSCEKKKKTLYKRFTEYFDKKVEKAEKELPPKIEKGMETFTDKLEDFENDIHAEQKKQSKFAKIFNACKDAFIYCG